MKFIFFRADKALVRADMISHFEEISEIKTRVYCTNGKSYTVHASLDNIQDRLERKKENDCNMNEFEKKLMYQHELSYIEIKPQYFSVAKGNYRITTQADSFDQFSLLFIVAYPEGSICKEMLCHKDKISSNEFLKEMHIQNTEIAVLSDLLQASSKIVESFH